MTRQASHDRDGAGAWSNGTPLFAFASLHGARTRQPDLRESTSSWQDVIVCAPLVMV